MKHQAACVHVLGFGVPVPKYCPSDSLNMCWPQSKKEHKVFHFSSNIQKQKAFVQQDSKFKKRPEISGAFLERWVFYVWFGDFFSFLFKLSGKSLLQRTSNRFPSHNEKIQGLLFLPLEQRHLKQKLSEKIQEWHPQNWSGRLSDRSMQTSFSCLLSLAHFKGHIYIH